MLTPSDHDLQLMVRALVAAAYTDDVDDRQEFYDEHVIDAFDDFPSPKGLYATVRRIDPATEQGTPERLYTNGTGNDLDAETLYHVSGTWSLQWFGDDHLKSGYLSPFDAARRFRLWCVSPAGIEQFQRFGFRFLRSGPERELTELASDGYWERRAGLDLAIAYQVSLMQTVGSIARIPLNLDACGPGVNGAIVFETSGARWVTNHRLRLEITAPSPSITARVSRV